MLPLAEIQGLDPRRPAYKLVCLENFIARKSPSAGALACRAALLSDFCRYREAFADLKCAERILGKPHPYFFEVRAEAYALQGKWKSAARCYTAAVNLNKSPEAPRVELAEMLLRQGRFDDAQRALRSAWRRRTDVNSEKAALLLASSFAAQQQYDEAEQWFRRLNRLRPDSVSAEKGLQDVELARSLARRGHEPGIQERLRELDQVEELEPTTALEVYSLWAPQTAYSLAQLASALTKALRLHEALLVQRRLRRVHPALALQTLAKMYYDSGRYRAAAKVYGQLTTNDDTVAWIFRGSALARAGLLQEAQRSYEQAVTCVDGDVDEAWLNLGLVLRAQGQFSKAAECCQRALEMSPGYEIARETLEDVQSALSVE